MRLSAALLVVLLVASAAGVATGQSVGDRARAPRVAAGDPAPTASLTTSAVGRTNGTRNATVDTDTVIHVALRRNGDARWNVTARFALRDSNETAAFRRLAKGYENGDVDKGFTRETFERVLERAQTDTDRSMTIRNVERAGRLLDNGSVGALSLSFTWTNFTQVDGERIVLGDVFWVDSETWLPTLSDGQTLTIAGPDDYYISGASPSGGTITNGTNLRYDGPHEFVSGDFAVTYSPKETKTSTSTTTTPAATTFLGLSTTGLAVVVLLLFGLGGVGAYAVSQRRGPDTPPDDATEAAGSAQTADAATAPAAEPAGDDAGDEDTPTELLSDEERVLRLLRDNDGRMKQGQIVKETNWSNAKVSQLLSKMDDNDDVDKLRIGRENLITLPDEDVTDVD